MNFELLARNLLSQSHSLVPQWLPGGKIQGHEYVCGSIQGGPGNSFHVNLTKGAWAEFSSDDLKGGDLISLFAAIKGISQGEAYQQLGGSMNGDAPSMRHPKHGDPSNYWVYRQASGNPYLYVARYNTPTGKEFLPWRKEGQKWICKSLPAPRPLYGLDLLANAPPDKPVLVVEGEKAADAARALAPEFIVVTWPNGAKAWAKADWTPLYGRAVVLWPDADEPGVKAMKGIAKFLHPKCPKVKLLDVSDHKDGWDAADALADSFDKPKLYQWIKVTQVVNVESLQVVEPSAEEEPATPSQMVSIEELGLANKRGVVICNASNVVLVFERSEDYKGHIWWDDFYGRAFTDLFGPACEWSDHHTSEVMISLQSTLAMHRLSATMVQDAAIYVARRNRRNEVRDWLQSLKWDGQERIGKFFITHLGSEPSNSVQSFGSNFFVLMVKRIFTPGSKADYMVVLEGLQGAKKSMALEAIGGKWYFASAKSFESDEFPRDLQGKWLVEISELHSFSKTEQTKIKHMITQQNDRYREKYGRLAQDHPRQCLMAGTTNETEWIKDQTGGRRFWPIRCGKIEIDLIIRDRDQLFAEAVHRYCVEHDEGYHVPEAETLEIQEERRERDAWEEILKNKLSLRDAITTLEAISELGVPLERIDDRVTRRVCRALRRIGFKYGNRRTDGYQTKAWIRPLNDILPNL